MSVVNYEGDNDGNTANADKKSVNFTTIARVDSLLSFLASDELEGRDTGSKGIALAADYIENYLKESSVPAYYSTYKDTLSNYDLPAFNVVGVVEGTDKQLKDEFIIIGAHYDHIGRIGKVNNDAIANGANDNASGTVTVMELARYFGTTKSNKRSLIFVLFSAEEKGLLGSEHLASRMKEEGLNLYTMLNFEMVGVPMVNKNHLTYITGYDKSNLAQIANTYSGSKLAGFLPTAKQFNLFKRSDNYPFAKIFNVPAHTFCTFDFTNFNFYHKPGDEYEVMDINHMVKVINTFIPVVEGIANSPTKELILASK